jgi:hypothetical protein
MSGKRIGKEKKWIREHSLPSIYKDHVCMDCRRYFTEKTRTIESANGYCAVKMKTVEATNCACISFELGVIIRYVRKGKRGEKWEKQVTRIHGTLQDDLARKMMMPKQETRWPPIKKPINSTSLKPGDKPRIISNTFAENVDSVFLKPNKRRKKTEG